MRIHPFSHKFYQVPLKTHYTPKIDMLQQFNEDLNPVSLSVILQRTKYVQTHYSLCNTQLKGYGTDETNKPVLKCE